MISTIILIISNIIIYNTFISINIRIFMNIIYSDNSKIITTIIYY